MHSLKREEVRKKRLPPLGKGRALGGVSGIFATVLLLGEIENLTELFSPHALPLLCVNIFHVLLDGIECNIQLGCNLLVRVVSST